MKELQDTNTGRIFKLLEHFEQVKRPVGVMEVSELFGIPRSSTALLFSTLVKLGYLQHDRASRTYVPSLRLSQLGRWVDRLLFGDERALLLPFAAHLREESGETVVLGVQDDLHAHYIHVELPDRPMVYLVRAGATRPICRSAIGWTLLSTLADETVETILKRSNALPENHDKPVAAKELRRQVAHVRSEGYAFSRHAFMPGIGMIAMLLPRAADQRQIAVGVGGPMDRLDGREEEIVQLLREGIETYIRPARDSADHAALAQSVS